jgi:hypothetical protein
VTRLRHWVAVGALLPLLWVGSVVLLGGPKTLGYAVLAWALAVVPSTGAVTVLGAVVLRVASRLPEPGDPRRPGALAAALAVTAVVTSVVGAAALSGTVLIRVGTLGVLLSVVVAGLPLTACAAAAWTRWPSATGTGRAGGEPAAGQPLAPGR